MLLLIICEIAYRMEQEGWILEKHSMCFYKVHANQ